jgi:hypothetical protein
MLGMEDLSAMRPGCPANFNIFDQAGHRTGSIFNGRRFPKACPTAG